MKFKATLSCAVCGFANTVNVNTGFDCSNLVCPKCKNEDCLSITSVSETSSEDNYKKQSILRRLRMIQEL